jgi:agmatinase
MEWLRRLIEKGFPSGNVLIVGARNIKRDETEFLKKNNIKIIGINQILEDIDDTCDIIMEFSDGKELYVSIDIDVVDPVFAPSTGYPETGGLTSRQLLYLIQRINKIKNLKGLDIVEINEGKDKDRISVKLGAKILAELI